jgi:hypothetical protein
LLSGAIPRIYISIPQSRRKVGNGARVIAW